MKSGLRYLLFEGASGVVVVVLTFAGKVAWLAHPGTSGGSDYVHHTVVDRIVAPPE